MSTRGYKFVFSEGEKVLCYEPDPNKAKVLYDSKILECCLKKDGGHGRGSKRTITAEYLVHFYGWNSSWDRHIAEQNILKDNPENRLLQRQLAEIAAEQLKGKKVKLNKIPAIIKEVVVGSPSKEAASSASSQEIDGKDEDGKGKESDVPSRNTGDDDDSNICNTDTNSDNLISETSVTDDGPLLQPSFMQLPEDLKSLLEEDQDAIENGGNLHSLPAKITVKMILDKYLAEHLNCNNENNPVCTISTRNKTSSTSKETRFIIKEFVASLEMYFNSVLPNHLLYASEKPKLATIVKQHKNLDYSQIYGFVHLLRLLVVLPEFFTSTTGITKKQLNALFKLFQEFITFLAKNKSNLME